MKLKKVDEIIFEEKQKWVLGRNIHISSVDSDNFGQSFDKKPKRIQKARLYKST